MYLQKNYVVTLYRISPAAVGSPATAAGAAVAGGAAPVPDARPDLRAA